MGVAKLRVWGLSCWFVALGRLGVTVQGFGVCGLGLQLVHGLATQG